LVFIRKESDYRISFKVKTTGTVFQGINEWSAAQLTNNRKVCHS
jgi:hypothetical protein